MIYDLQKGSLLKRASAFLLDVILLAILAVGFACLLSAILHFDSYSNTYESGLEKYSSQYGVRFEVSRAEYDLMAPQQRINWDKAYDALLSDQEVMRAYQVMTSMTVAITSISIFLAYMVMEFVLPIIFGNGQTVGKKVFGLAVMRTSGVKLTNIALFARTFLGKYTIETMIPALIVTMVFFNAIGIVGPLVILLIIVLEVIMVASTKTNSMIHDIIADCVVVDLASQLIFDSEEEMIEYKKRVAAENAARSTY